MGFDHFLKLWYHKANYLKRGLFMKKKITRLIALTLAILLAIPLTYGCGYIIGSVQNKQNAKTGYKKPVEKLNVMTLNICSWSFDGKDLETRADYIATTIRDNKTDTIGIQEGTPYWMNELNKRLEDDYGYVGVGGNSGKDYKESEDPGDEFTAIFYLKSKFEVVESGYFWLSETPEESTYGWGSAYKRICNWVILKNKYTNNKFVHINTHFDNASSEARKNSIGMILDKAKEFNDLPVVFTGDLNFLEISRGYRDITADVLKDTKKLAPKTMHSQTFHGTDPNAFKDYVLDYVLINDGFEALEYKVLKNRHNFRYISDHHAVLARLQFKTDDT